MKNEKGFLLAEALIVSTFVLTILIVLFIQFSNLTNNYKNSYSHNNVEALYDLSSVATYLKNNQYDLASKLTTEKPFVILYENGKCNMDAGLVDTFCDEFMSEMGAKTIIYTYSDVNPIQYYVNNNQTNNIGQKLREFISKIDAKEVQNKGRLFAEFTNDTYSTIAFDTSSYETVTTALQCTKENTVTEGSGLYLNEDGSCTFKGKTPNNYIRFNGELWRVISLGNDGTIKIVRNEPLNSSSFDTKGSRIDQSYCTNTENGCNAWATSENYINGTLKGNVTKDSTLNTYLNNDYLDQITENKRNIITHTWNIGPVTNNNNHFKQQLESESKMKWDGKIGLLTVSEYLNANNNKTQCESLSLNNSNNNCINTNWMYDILKENQGIWTISPNTNDNYNIFEIKNGKINLIPSSNQSLISPVLYLTDKTVITGGTGTFNNPYTIDTENIKIELLEPQFEETGTGPKQINITFQEECKDFLTCTYQVNGGELVTVKDSTATVRMTQNGSILATVSDGENMLSNAIDVQMSGVNDSISLEISTSSTSNSITVIANATSQINITKYEYSIDGQNWIEDKNSHTFTNLSHGKSYNIMVRATNENNKTASQTKNVSTLTLTQANFTEEGINPKIITITYPEGCGSSLTCSYQKDNGQRVSVNSPIIKIQFDKAGTLNAYVSDGSNAVINTYTVKFD